MPITPQQISSAQAIQHAAAHDPSPQVRLVAGPGTGKSFAVEERVAWLLSLPVQPANIYVISFTRASSRDLRDRIAGYCSNRGLPNASLVSVTTLHSLALRSLRAAGLLVYPTDPLVLDDWELDNLHDPEYSSATGFRPGRVAGSPPARARQVRLEYEAFCGTGQYNPPGYIIPAQPASLAERQHYTTFHGVRTQLYSYVLPGEIVRQCVDRMTAGALNPAELLNMHHLIVDEYQDLNPSDLEFVDILIAFGVAVFVAGDDDQSLYSFRYASPQGIQGFLQRHPSSGHHYLSDCFRSTPNVLAPALDLMGHFAEPTRIPKSLSSLYIAAQPPEYGLAFRWRFTSGALEARAIAESCRDLVLAGLNPREIMVLLSNTRACLPSMLQALQVADVPFDSPRGDSPFDARSARFAFAAIRIACDPNDYVAHRLLLGLFPHVGPTICNLIAQVAITHNLNYRDLFYHPIRPNVFQRREAAALTNARQVCAVLPQWQPSDTIALRSQSLDQLIRPLFGDDAADQFASMLLPLPQDASLLEARDYLWADNDEQRAAIMRAIFNRVALALPPQGFLPLQVRIMTMHGAKGLGATVVFVPALEEQILPGPRRQPYPGLVLEAARLLYVSITRATAACVLSFASSRYMYGNVSHETPSRFNTNLAGAFLPRTSGLNAQEITQVLSTRSNL
jgi:DNA helicase-2/ATP-dependent DNA helicase PcrA